MISMEREMEIVDVEAQTSRTVSVKEAPAIFKEPNRPVTMTFENIFYKVKTPKSDEKIILKGVTGKVQPGEMLAMLGPSGSGKTTLLTALGGRLGGRLDGTINYNGEKFSNKMKRKTGFVTQDDVLYPHLTVSETLVFTALLRLPNNFTKKEKIAHAEEIISELGLTRCKDSIVGGPMLRGVSGGERKRVSIGQEMLINPSLLFLDEPTSGLDSTTAQRIVCTLWELANGGRTVVMTIHQPSSRLFYMFHKILLLSEGTPLYFGKGAEVMDYFANVGYSPSVAMNPTDFLLDIANGILSDNSSPEDQALIKQTLVTAYKTNLEEKLIMEVRQTGVCHSMGPEEKKFAQWATTWSQQFSVLLRRGLKEWKHETFNMFKIVQILVVTVLCGLLWFKSSVAHLQDQTGLLFFIPCFWGFFSLYDAMFTFPQERGMLQKERASGMYRLSSYFMARTIGDLPMQLVLPTFYITVTYWMVGLKPNALSFIETLFAVLFNVLVAQSLGLAVGAVVMDQKSATTLGGVIMLTFQVGGGFLVLNIPPFIAWIKYLSVTNYAYKLLLMAQFKPTDTYPCSDNRTCLIADFPAIKPVGLDGKAISVVAMAIMLIAYRVIAYIALTRIGVTKKYKLRTCIASE